MSGLLNNIVPFFGLILLGYICAKIFRHEENGLVWLNRFVIYAALPPLIFQIIRKASPEGLLNIPFFLGTTASTFLIFMGAVLLMRLLYRPSVTQLGVQGATASYGNIGYIGLPLCIGVLGPEAAVPAILVFCFDNTLQFILVPTFNALDSEKKLNPVALIKRIAARVLLHPFIVATLAGIVFLLADLSLPTPIDNLLSKLEKAAGPCALFALGVTVALQKTVEFRGEFVTLIVAKTLIHPMLTFTILSLIGGFEPVWMSVALLMAALPTASNVFVMASDYKTYINGSSYCILISTIISFFTISGLLLMLE